MNFIRKEDTAKAAKLGGAVAAVFLLAAWRVVGAVSPPKPDAPPSETVGASTATSPTNGAPTTAPASEGKPDEGPIEPVRPTLGSMVDPFRTIVPVRLALPEPHALPMPASLAGGPLPPATPMATVGTTLTRALAPAVEATMKVSGILSGQNATAVIETGKDTSVVRVGSRLPNGSEVVAISSTTVSVRQNGKIRVLDVGN